jgi:hypothetical protein
MHPQNQQVVRNFTNLGLTIFLIGRSLLSRLTMTVEPFLGTALCFTIHLDSRIPIPRSDDADRTIVTGYFEIKHLLLPS